MQASARITGRGVSNTAIALLPHLKKPMDRITSIIDRIDWLQGLATVIRIGTSYLIGTVGQAGWISAVWYCHLLAAAAFKEQILVTCT